MSKMNGVDFSSITALSGKSLVQSSGGEAHVLSQPDTGTIAYGGLSLSSFPFDWADFFSDIPTYGYEVSTTEFTKLKMNQTHILALDSSGNLYHKSSSNSNTQKWGSTDITVFQQVLTNVSGFWIGGSATAFALAIKTDGTLWGVGYNYYGTLGLGNQTSQNSWTQIGSDTDWKDIAVGTYNSWALKGGSTDTYLYACGRNNYGQTGQGTTSGNTTSWTRVKSAASTDWSENLNYSMGSFKIGGNQHGLMVINSSGELWMAGRANSQFPASETSDVSNGSNQTYMIKLGTSTDWQQLVTGNYDSAFRKGSKLYTCGNTFGFNDASSSYYAKREFNTDTDWNDFDDTIQHGYGNGQSAARIFKKGGDVKIWGYPATGAWNSPTSNVAALSLSSLNSFPTGATINSVAVQIAGSNNTMLIMSVS